MLKRSIFTMLAVFFLTIVLAGCTYGEKNLSEETSPEIPIREVAEPTLPCEPINVEKQANQIIKYFVVPQEADLYTLTEAPFTEGDYIYNVSAIEKQMIPGDIETKTVTQTIPVEVPNSSQAEALAWYSPELDYSDAEGFVGRTTLQPETLIVTANGTKTYTYQITDSRQYFNLIRNDPSVIPRTTTKNGRTLTLVNIDWQIAEQSMAGDSLIATKYNATAHYAAKAQGTQATGYTAKATYVGEASRQGAEKISCAVIYTGKLTTSGLVKRLLIPILTIALLLSLFLPSLLRRRQLRHLNAQAALTEQMTNESIQSSTQAADEHKPSRLKNWWQSRKQSPIFVELEETENGEPAKAKKIYLPKENKEKGDDDNE